MFLPVEYTGISKGGRGRLGWKCFDNRAPGLGAEPPAAGGYGGLEAKPPAAEENLQINLRSKYSRFCVILIDF